MKVYVDHPLDLGIELYWNRVKPENIEFCGELADEVAIYAKRLGLTDHVEIVMAVNARVNNLYDGAPDSKPLGTIL